jgi:uncharacterized membrane protein
MMWLGLLVGLVLGGLWNGFETAMALGFVGWLAGLIAGTVRKAKAEPSERMQMIERRLASIEKRLAKIEEPAPAIPTASSEEPAAPIAEPIQSPPEPIQAPAEAVAPPQVERPVEPAPARAPHPIVAWLMGGNTIARVGLVILFLGLAFLLKWAAEHAVLPPELRVGGVALVGVVLLVFGWRLRERRSGYALGLQGGGVAVLYLTTFAALRLYALLPPALAFILLAAIAVFSGVLAVTQDALVLAAFGAGGGFLAPILASTGQGSHVALFSYYLLLNLGIAGVALFRSWRSLNIMGFVFTFVIGAVWGARFYTPESFASTEPFLAGFFLLYVALAVVQALKMEPEGKPYLDGILVFGVPIAAFALQAGLMRDTEYGLAFSCVAASALYLALAAALRRQDRVRMLFECFLALGVVFATLAIPLALDARWTSALWALEGAAVVWIGVRQQRRVATGFGLVMQLLAGAAFGIAYLDMKAGIPWLDAMLIGALLIAAAAFWTNLVLRRSPWPGEDLPLAPIAFLWGFAWLLFALHHEVQREIEIVFQPQAYVAAYALLACAFLALSRRLAWKEASWPSLTLMPAIGVFALDTLAVDTHPFVSWGAAAWLVALAAHFWSARRHESVAAPGWLRAEHLGVVLIFAALAAWDLHFRVIRETAPDTAWSVAAVIVPAALMLLAASAQPLDARWPIRDHAHAYRKGLPIALGAVFTLWILFANATHDGTSTPLAYLPFLNALDLGHILVALAMVSALLAARRSGFTGPLPRIVPLLAGALAFIWLNGVLLRTLHHWAAIPYRMEPMMRSMLVQASLSIFWSVLALALMLFATRRGHRPLWITGASLMGVVVLKLFVVELSHVGAVERIVSFIAVGLAMLAIGYMAPVPPRTKEVAA